MASTFLNLTNRLLRRINEVEISEADFSNTRGIQTLAKDAILDAIAQINQSEYEWPFNAAEHTQILAVGQEEYSWPPFFKSADWNTFQLQKDDSLNINHKRLKFIERDQYVRYHQDADDDASTTGLACPEVVFPSHGNGYGVSMSPDKQYTLQFKYFLKRKTCFVIYFLHSFNTHNYAIWCHRNVSADCGDCLCNYPFYPPPASRWRP